MYYEFEEPVKKLAGHRVLALNRGEKEKFLTIKVAAPEEDILRYLEKQVITRDNPFTTPILKEVTEDSYKRLIAPDVYKRQVSCYPKTISSCFPPEIHFGNKLSTVYCKTLHSINCAARINGTPRRNFHFLIL